MCILTRCPCCSLGSELSEVREQQVEGKPIVQVTGGGEMQTAGAWPGPGAARTSVCGGRGGFLYHFQLSLHPREEANLTLFCRKEGMAQ